MPRIARVARRERIVTAVKREGGGGEERGVSMVMVGWRMKWDFRG